MGRFEIYIPRWHPARLNTLMGMHHMAASRRKKADKEMVWSYSTNLPKAKGRRRVEFTIVLKKGQRGGDPDSYFKSGLDALKHAGMLVDDNRQSIDLQPIRYERGTEADWGTAIVLEDVDGG